MDRSESYLAGPAADLAGVFANPPPQEEAAGPVAFPESREMPLLILPLPHFGDDAASEPPPSSRQGGVFLRTRWLSTEEPRP